MDGRVDPTRSCASTCAATATRSSRARRTSSTPPGRSSASRSAWSARSAARLPSSRPIDGRPSGRPFDLRSSSIGDPEYDITAALRRPTVLRRSTCNAFPRAGPSAYCRVGTPTRGVRAPYGRPDARCMVGRPRVGRPITSCDSSPGAMTSLCRLSDGRSGRWRPERDDPRCERALTRSPYPVSTVRR